MSIEKLTVHQLYTRYQNRELKPTEVAEAYIQSYKKNSHINAYIEHFTQEAQEKAESLTSNTENSSLLWGIPGAVKDNFAVKGKGQSCASKMLQNYIAPYDSSVVEQLNQENFINLGRLNLDEFAMGSTGRYSAYGPTENPLDAERVIGGSSGGSAAAVASYQSAFTIGSDTGGSSRLPASYAGVCGFKPTYGAISRYGLNAFAPSFDVPGILAHTPEDIAMVYQHLRKHDTRDQIIRNIDFEWSRVQEMPSLKGTKIAFFDALLERADTDVVRIYEHIKTLLKEAGATLIPVKLDLEEYLIKTYYILTCSEASSTLSRFDGMRYGGDPSIAPTDVETLVAQNRTQNMGHEVMRRILMGNYFVMSANYDKWYMRALHVRGLLVEKLNALSLHEGASLWLWPGFHEAALINAPERDNYTSDSVAVLANLYGGPAVAIPTGVGGHGLPVSVQIAGAVGNDERVLQLANFIYKQENWKNLRY
ncbi:amidase family protein [Entomospira entomophila]|uniref:Asp-tRNA(Asn)/Glu-tRNA(Gln) amidotransferase subunit GatA n=1 Tax=Entomospira entomophila TaxID=2719988 RepID=A0A968G7M0_9SPIO|nr:amidase family protein [Entomospira entomophilus]NIZ40068.1 Asp-tRNA(Asn)/Glu-tRNA(Gln) amidotransferase subunit GatA [Entomospira entomophilus]WDI35629.1 amidase family protein [Entomospira entomophilus]